MKQECKVTLKTVNYPLRLHLVLTRIFVLSMSQSNSYVNKLQSNFKIVSAAKTGFHITFNFLEY